MSTCKHCGRPVKLSATYWVHEDGWVMCPDLETQAEPR